MELPASIRKLLGDKAYETDSMGLSQASVLLFPDCVLKVQTDSPEARTEAEMLRYLKGKVPVPAVLAHEVWRGNSYLLMERCPGEMACGENYLADPALLCRLLADGLKTLWAVDIRDCPSDQRLDYKLAQAACNVAHGLVDLENVEPETFGPNGFRDPAHLLEWLNTHRPAEEPVLSHGDYCLPNVFGQGGQVTGFIDLGRAGVGDKWCDIALCCRSLRGNFGGQYGGVPYPGYDDALFFQALGLEPDEEKIRYYILLDELF